MVSFSALPAALVALLMASAVFSAPTSPNDPFRAIAVRIPRQPDPPICCLKPLPPLDPVDDEVLLSFEQWKAKQFAMEAQAKAKAKEKDSTNRSGYVQGPGGTGGTGGQNGSEALPIPSDIPVSSDSGFVSTSQDVPERLPDELVSPHFRVPLTDRFNYASLDCSARVHTSHRSAKSPSSILSSKRDRYMLSPCTSSKEKQFVVVELCEDIRLDTVQLANFEFFSGVFKDFTVSVAKTYTTEAEGWTVAGTYKAKNVRGVQSFHPPTSLRDFYRYIRIDFQSHYGNEFYCPVSLLRVYGLTHLEQWKWDIWEAESRAKRSELEEEGVATPSLPAEVVVEAPRLLQTSQVNTTGDGGTELNSSSILVSSFGDPDPTYDNATDDRSIPSADGSNGLKSARDMPTTFAGDSMTSSSGTHVDKESILPTSSPAIGHSGSGASTPADSDFTASTAESMNGHKSDPSTTKNYDNETSVMIHETAARSIDISVSTTISLPGTSSVSDSNSQSWKLPPPEKATANTVNSPSSRLSSSSSATTTSATTVVASPPPSTTGTVPSAPPPAPASTGESIYRTIMNRLTALEANHTLYARYVEEQTSGVRDVLKRLGEDVGRLEGIGKAQAQMYHRTVQEWEKQRHRLEMDYGELMSRVNYLSDEIVLEKRLGIAQLCLLMAVLVFMGLTRGSRGESLMEHAPVRFNKSMREWGQRHLSFNNDWVSRFKGRSRSPKSKPKPAKPAPDNASREEVKVEFPTQDTRSDQTLTPSKLHPYPVTEHGSKSLPRTGSRSRTPSHRTPAMHPINLRQWPVTPAGGGLRLPLQRANSQGGGPVQSGSWSGGGGAAPRSAKRWARTAHLHEMRGFLSGGKLRRDDGGDGKPRGRKENDIVDVFSTPTAARRNGYRLDGHGSRYVLELKGKGKCPQISSEYQEASLWVDTDASVGGSEAELDVDLL